MGVITCYPNDPDVWVWSLNVQRQGRVERRDVECMSTFVLPDSAIFR
jgi:hypothetical protein